MAMDQYNWDNLDVGRFDLNHSENFFAFKHSKHEHFTAENIGTEIMIDEEESKENEQPSQDPLDLIKSIKTETTPESFPKSTLTVPNSDPTGTLKKNKICKSPLSDKRRPIKNLLSQPFTNNMVQKNDAPGVCKYSQIYELKKKEIRKKMLEEEKKNRVFHSRPAPNFNAAHENLIRKQQNGMKHLTAPITPHVLKKSKEAIERKRQRVEALTVKIQPPKYHARDAKVLHEEPFIPKREHHLVELQPFNLHVEKRLFERKQYDECIQRKFEEKKKQEEQERNRREEELAKEFRKMTTFKARPNPFKKFLSHSSVDEIISYLKDQSQKSCDFVYPTLRTGAKIDGADWENSRVANWKFQLFLSFFAIFFYLLRKINKIVRKIKLVTSL